jgi:hypothetical protein
MRLRERLSFLIVGPEAEARHVSMAVQRSKHTTGL